LHTALTILAGALCLTASVPIALLWRSSIIRALVVGIVGYAFLTVAFHVLAVSAALTGGSLVTPGNLVIATALLGAASWGVRVRRIAQRRRSNVEEPAPSPKAHPRARLNSTISAPVLVLAVVLAALLACAVASGLSAPPRGWDVLTYHLPRAVSWLQHGDLGAYGPEAAFYPGNAELLVLMGLFPGTDRLVPLFQAPFLVLAGLALFALARTIGARRWSAAIASLVFVASPMAFFHSTVAKNDLIVAALVLSGVLFLLRSLEPDGKRNSRTWEISLAGLSLGLAAGTKYTILPFVAVLALTVITLILVRGSRARARARGDRIRGDAARTICAFAVCLALPSAFWYVRNLLVTGSPVAPLLLAESTALPEGWIEQQFQFVTSVVQWWAQPLIDRQSSTYTGSAGFGAAFGMLYIPAIVIYLESVVAKGTAPELRRKRGALLVAVVLGVAAWWFGGFHLPRYLLPMVAIACAPLALLLETVKKRARVALLFLVAVALVFSTAETMRIVYRDGDLTWSNLGGVERREFYRVPDVVEEFPVGTKIMLLRVFDEEFYFGTFRYPLVGRLPGNDVVMEADIEFRASLSDMEPMDAHRLLVEARVDYVFMRVFLHEPFTTWFDDHPDLYEPVYKNLDGAYRWYHVPDGSRVMTRIYRVI
jgi:hypothetical protein